MAELDGVGRWEKYVPDIGKNRELPIPFYLEVAANLSNQEMRSYYEKLQELLQLGPELKNDDFIERAAVLFENHLRRGDEPLRIKGAPITTLREYLTVVLRTKWGLREMLQVVQHANSAEGVDQLFSERLSGGWTGTASGRTAKDTR